MSGCAQFFPPSAAAAWFLEVVDTAAIDEGTIQRFEVFAPDGSLVGSADVPVAIPDDELANIKTVGDAMSYIQKNKA